MQDRARRFCTMGPNNASWGGEFTPGTVSDRRSRPSLQDGFTACPGSEYPVQRAPLDHRIKRQYLRFWARSIGGADPRFGRLRRAPRRLSRQHPLNGFGGRLVQPTCSQMGGQPWTSLDIGGMSATRQVLESGREWTFTDYAGIALREIANVGVAGSSPVSCSR